MATKQEKVSNQDENRHGEAAAGTKQIGKPAQLLTANKIEDGGASNKGQKVPPVKAQV